MNGCASATGSAASDTFGRRPGQEPPSAGAPQKVHHLRPRTWRGSAGAGVPRAARRARGSPLLRVTCPIGEACLLLVLLIINATGFTAAHIKHATEHTQSASAAPGWLLGLPGTPGGVPHAGCPPGALCGCSFCAPKLRRTAQPPHAGEPGSPRSTYNRLVLAISAHRQTQRKPRRAQRGQTSGERGGSGGHGGGWGTGGPSCARQPPPP